MCNKYLAIVATSLLTFITSLSYGDTNNRSTGTILLSNYQANGYVYSNREELMASESLNMQYSTTTRLFTVYTHSLKLTPNIPTYISMRATHGKQCVFKFTPVSATKANYEVTGEPGTSCYIQDNIIQINYFSDLDYTNNNSSIHE